MTRHTPRVPDPDDLRFHLVPQSIQRTLQRFLPGVTWHRVGYLRRRAGYPDSISWRKGLDGWCATVGVAYLQLHPSSRGSWVIRVRTPSAPRAISFRTDRAQMPFAVEYITSQSRAGGFLGRLPTAESRVAVKVAILRAGAGSMGWHVMLSRVRPLP